MNLKIKTISVTPVLEDVVTQCLCTSHKKSMTESSDLNITRNEVDASTYCSSGLCRYPGLGFNFSLEEL